MARGISGEANGARKSALPDWREYLTPSECVDLEALEKNAAQLDAQRHRITSEITLWRNRCVQRRRLDLLKKAAEVGLRSRGAA
jgi:hypothetical protein